MDYEKKREELINMLMDYLREITGTEPAVSDEAVRFVPAIAEVIRNLLL